MIFQLFDKIFCNKLLRIGRGILPGIRRALLAVLVSTAGVPGRGQEVIEDATIDLFTNSFTPTAVTIRAGGTVTWKWRRGTHEIASGASSDPQDAPGALFDATVDEAHPIFSFRFDTPGTYAFFDRRHEQAAGSGDVTVVSEAITFRVGVVDNAYIPEDLFIFAGDTVHWQHEPMEMFHTVTSGRDFDDPNWGDLFDEDSSDLNADFFYTFDQPGLQPYFCRPHILLGMVGTVTIQSLFIRGDFNFDGAIDIADAVQILFALFLGQGSSDCMDAADADDNGQVETADVVRILEYLFTSGAKIPRPFPAAGPDRTDDNMICTP